MLEVDRSVLPAWVEASDVAVFRNGVQVMACTRLPDEANPDPCVASQILDAEGDLEITVLSSEASLWEFAVPEPELRLADPGGPYIAEEGGSITLDGTGSSAPGGETAEYLRDSDILVLDDPTSATPTADLTGFDDSVASVTLLVIADGLAAEALTDEGTVTGGGGAGTVADSHTYDEPGVYTVTLTVTDDDGGVGVAEFRYVVVYDPSAGFVTGGGWIDSPAGAYVPDPTVTGKATFGFVSKYKKGKTAPEGTTEFVFHGAGLNFHSDA